MGKTDGLRIASFISGRGSNNKAIIDACKSGRIKGDVVLVGSDNPEAAGLEYAKENNIDRFLLDYGKPARLRKENKDWEFEKFLPANFDLEDILRKQSFFDLTVMHKKSHAIRYFQNRAIVEAVASAKLVEYRIDLLVLAGFMRFLTPFLIDWFNIDPLLPRIMNIHPALLPAFPGEHGYADTYNYGCKVGGSTVFFIDYGEDDGPIIDQRVVTIYPKETLESFEKRGLAEEWMLYPACIQLFAEGRLQVVRRGERKVVEIN